MPEIEINYKPKVFDDPEFCEKDAKECKFLDTGCCILFDESPIFKPGEYYHKHQQCKDELEKVKKTKPCPVCSSQLSLPGEFFNALKKLREEKISYGKLAIKNEKQLKKDGLI